MKCAEKIEPLDIDAIHVGERMRAVDEDRVSALASSMAEIGLMNPISVRYFEEYQIDGKTVMGVPVLVAGATRLAAAKKLGWEMISCLFVEGDDVDAQLWEIDENLARTELTTEQKREHLRRRRELWEKRQIGGASCATNDLRSDGRRKGPQHQKSFAAETAAATGLSKSQINRLLAEPKPPAPKPVKLASEPLNEFETKQKWLAAGMSWWNRAPQEWREEFLERVDVPVFDRMARAG